jgi:sugar lactone lactonase YvrE
VTGAPTRRGWADGTGAAARFFSPSAVVADPDGNLFVADWANHCIRKITPDGVVTTVAGCATDEDVPEPGRTRDGAGAQARFYNPTGIAIDAARNLYVTDVNAHVVRKITPAGVVTTVAGQRGQGGYTDGDARSSLLDAPWSVAVDAQGILYVTERYQSTVRRIAPDGSISTWVGSPGQMGDADGVGTVARLDMPVGIAIDAAGTVYVSDAATHTIRKITAGAVVTTLAGKSSSPGLADGLNREARFKRPYGLAIGADGNLYVADIGNSAVRRVTPQGGVVSTVAGGNGDQRAVVLGESGRLNNPEALAVLPGAVPRLALIDENSVLVVTPR